MHSQKYAKARRMKKHGFTIGAIAKDMGLTEEVVREMLGHTPRKSYEAESRKGAIRKLRAEGWDEQAIAAVFGN